MEFEIVEHIANLSSKSAKGWTKELNIVKWGENNPKLDIRTWNEDHTRCGKGITLDEEEASILGVALEERGLI